MNPGEEYRLLVGLGVLLVLFALACICLFNLLARPPK